MANRRSKLKVALNEAKKLDPENPRISILEAEDLYYTPEQFGGSKSKGIELFKKALEQFKTYKTKSSVDPNWGQGSELFYLSG
jgi:cytochrome c-type biogenesis protein CcmH/NrfG